MVSIKLVVGRVEGLGLHLRTVRSQGTCEASTLRMVLPRRVHKPTCVPCPPSVGLGQLATSSLSKGLMGPDDGLRAVWQLELPVKLHIVAQLDGLFSPNISYTHRTGR